MTCSKFQAERDGPGEDVYHRSVDEVTAFILAGGKSSRMGSEKAFLELGGRSLLVRALELTGKVAQQVRVVGDKVKFTPFGTVIEDIYRDRGPLGGIHAALVSSETDLNLMLAVDLPFISVEFLKYLTFQAAHTNSVVTVPRTDGRFQPLCAIYRRAFAQVAECSLQKGENKIGSLFREVNTRVIEEEELTSAGFGIQMFRNLNTPEDWRHARLDQDRGQNFGSGLI